MGVKVLRHPTDSTRWDTFHVDSSGNLVQKAYYDGSWHSATSLISGCVANTTPDGAWLPDGSEIHMYAQGSGTSVKHWYWDGSNHTETL